ncbi:putative universal stress protein UspA [Polaribacter irgensii 23-P]|jgi:nucleotide-binding universal stress UspA family protein|uniref:Putative universal stress protein UspA n=1 Tax=Polaribacter irgensii 23-P TaxID=313594 RepID=A4BXW2_9FLAO|nr:universal stress protein [Polaribacter irgensii]EAR13803.1 putative universal stress protein UspA [Polaribacter irgensii 23-P]
MKHILVPIGSTENAQKTLQYAIDFAAAINAKIFVFRAYSSLTKAGTMINVDTIITRETNLYLRAMVNSCVLKNVDIKLISAKGSVVDSVAAIDQELGIDLVIVGAKSNSIKENLFLGRTAGSLVKRSNVAVLTIPEGYIYKPVSTILMAFKSGIIKSKTILKPLQFVVEEFKADVNLLLVKTPNYTEEDLILHPHLKALQSTLTVTENATTFQGVLEHIKIQNPDMVCVLRRKRGFFQKLWEKNTILKEEFYSNVPLLVLKG